MATILHTLKFAFSCPPMQVNSHVALLSDNSLAIVSVTKDLFFNSQYRALIRTNGEIDNITSSNERMHLIYDHENGTCVLHTNNHAPSAPFPISAVGEKIGLAGVILWAAKQFRETAPPEFTEPLIANNIMSRPKTVGYIAENEDDRKKATQLPSTFSSVVSRDLGLIEQTNNETKSVSGTLSIHKDGVQLQLTSHFQSVPDRPVTDLYLFDTNGNLQSHIQFNYNNDVIIDETYKIKPLPDGQLPFVANYDIHAHFDTGYRGEKYKPRAEALALKAYDKLIKLVPLAERQHVANEAVNCISPQSGPWVE